MNEGSGEARPHPDEQPGERRGARLPLAVLMSGAPGSGKSTLARELGQRLRLPVVEKDRLREGAWWTLGVDELDQAPPGPPLWYGAMESLLAHGISVIGDMTLFRGVSEPDIARRLSPRARLVNVHCRTPGAVARYESRARADPVHRHRVDGLLPLVRQLQVEVFEPLELGWPCVLVDTTDGYIPSLEYLVGEITRLYRITPPDDLRGS
jgi:predicted kinase